MQPRLDGNEMAGMGASAVKNSGVASFSGGEAHKLGYMTELFLPDQLQQIKMLVNVAIILLGWLSVTLETFIRYNFGVRYFNPLRFALAGAMLSAYVLLGSFGAAQMNRFAPDLGVLWIAFLVFSAAHFLRGWWRMRKGIRWHTMSFGRSILGWLPIRNWTLFCYVEPALAVAGGAVLALQFHVIGLGVWLMVAGGALFIKNQLLRYEQAMRVWDMVDAQIEGEFFNALATGEKPVKQGFELVSVPEALLRPPYQPGSVQAAVQETLRPASAPQP